MEGEVKGSTFKMKGHALPGINQRIDAKATNVAEQGLAGSSVFQQVPPPLGTQPIIPPPVGGVGAMGGMDMGMAPPIMSKPSVAKIYDKPKGKRTEY